MKQELLWIPKGKDVGGSSLRCDPVPFKGKVPKYVWTLLIIADENNKPELPIKPIHHRNAFLEDRVHDWDIRKGQFFYYSRVTEGEVWVLLHYEKL